MSGTSASIVGVMGLLLAGLALETCARAGIGPATAAQALGAAMRTTLGARPC